MINFVNRSTKTHLRASANSKVFPGLCPDLVKNWEGCEGNEGNWRRDPTVHSSNFTNNTIRKTLNRKRGEVNWTPAAKT